MASRSEVAEFVMAYLQPRLATAKLTEVSDGTSLTATGLVDSFGLLDLVTAVEERFSIQIDMDTVDFEVFTTFGGFVDTAVR